MDEQKAEKLAEDLNSIFKFIEKLNELKTDNRWLLLAFDVAASERHLWTAWYSTKRNQKNGKMVANSVDAEFIRLIAGTHQVKIAFNNAGIRKGDESSWIIRLPESDIGNGIDEVYINRDSYNDHDSEASLLIEKMGGELISQRPIATLKGLMRIDYDKEVNETQSLEECFILHLVSSKI